MPPDVQRDIDLVLKRYRQRKRDEEALARLTSWLDDYANDRGLFDFSQTIIAVPPATLRAEYAQLDDDEITDHLRLAPGVEVTTTQRLHYFESLRLPAVFEDGDLSSGFTPLVITGTDGSSAVIVQNIRGYSFSGITTDWHGPLESFDGFREELVSSGWILDPKDFSVLPHKEKLRLLETK